MKTKEEELYIKIGKNIKEGTEGQMFGKPCFKINGKAFICYFNQCMVFKLNGDIHSKALSNDGALLFDPSSKNRPMKEWVQVPFIYADKWEIYANSALEYVKNLI